MMFGVALHVMGVVGPSTSLARGHTRQYHHDLFVIAHDAVKDARRVGGIHAGQS